MTGAGPRGGERPPADGSSREPPRGVFYRKHRSFERCNPGSGAAGRTIRRGMRPGAGLDVRWPTVWGGERNMKKRSLAWMMAFALTLLVAPAGSAQQKGRPALQFAATVFYNTWQYTYALKAGIAKVEGVDVQIKEFFSDQRDRVMLAGGQDCGELNWPTYMLGKAKGVAFTALSIGLSAAEVQGIVVSAESGIRSPSDLRGKRVGVGSLTAGSVIFMRGWLEHKAGLKASEITWVTKAVPQLYPLVLDRTLAAAWVWGDVMSKAQKDPKLRVLGYLASIWPERLGKSAFSTFVVCQEKFLKAHPGADVRLLRALRASREYALKHVDETARAYMKFRGGNLEAIKAEAPTAYLHYTLTDEQKKLVDLGVQFMMEQGLLKKKFTVRELFSDTIERLDKRG